MSTDLAIPDEQPTILAKAPFGFHKGQFWISVNLSDPDDAVNLLRLRQKGDREAKDCVNLPLDVVHIMRRWGEQTDNDSGEIKSYIGTTFMTIQGDTVSSGSIGLERDIESLFVLGLIPPWTPPLKITFKFSKTANGRDMLKMDFDLDDIKKRLKKSKVKK